MKYLKVTSFYPDYNRVVINHPLSSVLSEDSAVLCILTGTLNAGHAIEHFEVVDSDA